MIKMFMDSDFTFSKGTTEFRRLDLKDEVVPMHGVVASDGTLLFYREDEIKVFAAVRGKGRSFLFRGFYKRRPVLWQKGLENVAIGVGNGFDAVEFEFVWQATLPRSENPF